MINLWFSYTIGEKTTKEAIERVQIIWPHIMEMSNEDRALIHHAAYYCQVHKEYPLPESIKDCLRVGAMTMDALHPDRKSLKRLETLFSSAKA